MCYTYSRIHNINIVSSSLPTYYTLRCVRTLYLSQFRNSVNTCLAFIWAVRIKICHRVKSSEQRFISFLHHRRLRYQCYIVLVQNDERVRTKRERFPENFIVNIFSCRQYNIIIFYIAITISYYCNVFWETFCNHCFWNASPRFLIIDFFD